MTQPGRPEPGAAVRRPCSSLPLGLSAPHVGTGEGSVTSGPVSVRKPSAHKRMRLLLPGGPRPGPGRAPPSPAPAADDGGHTAPPGGRRRLNRRGRRRLCPPLPQGEYAAHQFPGAPKHRSDRPSVSTSPVHLLPARCPVYYFFTEERKSASATPLHLCPPAFLRKVQETSTPLGVQKQSSTHSVTSPTPGRCFHRVRRSLIRE